MKIKPEQLPLDVTVAAERLHSDHTSSQTLWEHRTQTLIMSYLDGPTLNSVTIASEDITGRTNEVRLTFNKDHTLKHAKTPRESSLSALRRYLVKQKRDAYKASQAEITTHLVRKAEKHIA